MLAFKFERLEEKGGKKKVGICKTIPGTAALFILRYIDDEMEQELVESVTKHNVSARDLLTLFLLPFRHIFMSCCFSRLPF